MKDKEKEESGKCPQPTLYHSHIKDSFDEENKRSTCVHNICKLGDKNKQLWGETLRRKGGHCEEGGTCSKPRETSLCHHRCSANTQTQQRLLYGDWLVNNRRCNREDQSKISIVNKSTCWKTLWWYLFERASKHDQTFVLVCKQLLIPQSKPEDGFEKQRLNWHAFVV